MINKCLWIADIKGRKFDIYDEVWIWKLQDCIGSNVLQIKSLNDCRVVLADRADCKIHHDLNDTSSVAPGDVMLLVPKEKSDSAQRVQVSEEKEDKKADASNSDIEDDEEKKPVIDDAQDNESDNLVSESE